jgi:hypothetical protein
MPNVSLEWFWADIPEKPTHHPQVWGARMQHDVKVRRNYPEYPLTGEEFRKG